MVSTIATVQKKKKRNKKVYIYNCRSCSQRVQFNGYINLLPIASQFCFNEKSEEAATETEEQDSSSSLARLSVQFDLKNIMILSGA